MVRAIAHGGLSWKSSLILFLNVTRVDAATVPAGGSDSTAFHDSLRVNRCPTISTFELKMPNSNPMQDAESPDGSMIKIVSTTSEKQTQPAVTVPAHLILGTIERNQIAIQSLYEKFLRRDQYLRGKITLTIIFDFNGIVRSAEIVQNTTKNNAFATELAQHIRRWIMPKVSPGSKLIRAVHTFVFG